MRELGWRADSPTNAPPSTGWSRWFWATSLGARLAVVCGVSAVCSLLISLWVSQSAWEAWWTAQDDWQLAHDDVVALEQSLEAQRAQIDQLQSQPHPAGFSVPAWQTWPPDQVLDERHVLSDWLAWGRQHGLQVQATRIESGQGAGTWEGRLPELLAAWQGLPRAVPRMVVMGFECERVQPAVPARAQPRSETLQLKMQWSVLQDEQRPPAVAQKKASTFEVEPPNPKPAANQPLARPAKAWVYQAFGEQALVSALPAQALTPLSWAQALGTWQTQPLETLRWKGRVSSGSRQWAWVAHEGLVHVVKLGDRLGQDWGEVLAIEPDHLQLREWHANAQGQWVSQLRRFPAVNAP